MLQIEYLLWFLKRRIVLYIFAIYFDKRYKRMLTDMNKYCTFQMKAFSTLKLEIFVLYQASSFLWCNPNVPLFTRNSPKFNKIIKSKSQNFSNASSIFDIFYDEQWAQIGRLAIRVAWYLFGAIKSTWSMDFIFFILSCNDSFSSSTSNTVLRKKTNDVKSQ